MHSYNVQIQLEYGKKLKIGLKEGETNILKYLILKEYLVIMKITE